MTPANRLRGRFLAFAAIIMVSAAIRPAVSGVAPVIGLIQVDLPLTAVAIGVLGLLAPVCYSIFGTISPWIASKLTLEWTLVMAMVVLAAGQVMRAVVGTDYAFIAWSFVAIGGIGIANVLLPPIIRRFFPDHFAIMTSLYSATLAIATFMPSFITPAVAEVSGWREAVGMWFILAALTLPLLVAVIARAGTSRNEINRDARKAVARKIWTSPTSWAIAGAFAISSFFAYTGMSWLPVVLTDRIGATALEAGAITAVFGSTGLPSNLIVPLLASRLKNPAWLYLVSGAAGTTGALGILLMPGTFTLVWAFLLGLGSMIFALNLYLLNQRTKTQEGTVVLSGMAQGIGYAVSALGPLMFGVLHEMTHGWDAPLIMLAAGGLGCIPIFLVLRNPTLVDAD
jgi:CP family cyanate transporter-like MFS transporter